MADSNIQRITALIKAGDLDQALTLLRTELREHPTADAWFLAAIYVASSRERRIAFLEKALELDPLHERAWRALEKVQGKSQNRVEPKQNDNQGAKTSEMALLDQAVSVFNRRGWNMSLATETTRKFDKKQQMNGLLALLLLLMFPVGTILVILSVLGAQTDHITLVTTGKGYLSGMSDRGRSQYRVQSLSDLESMAKHGWIDTNKKKRRQFFLFIIVSLLFLLVMSILCASNPSPAGVTIMGMALTVLVVVVVVRALLA